MIFDRNEKKQVVALLGSTWWARAMPWMPSGG